VNWDAIGTVAEVVGAFAVVISLVYVAVQLRAQNQESRLASVHEILEAFRNVQSSGSDIESCNLVIKGAEDFEALSDAERLRIFLIIMPNLRVWEEAYHQHKGGRLSDELWRAIVAQFRDVFAVSFVPRIWELRKHVFTDSFREYVDQIEAGEYRLK
jgi:phytoene dehydrogenase-like protein